MCTTVSKADVSDVLVKSRRFRVQSSDSLRIIEKYFASLDTALALSCLILLRHGEYDELVKKELVVDQYIDHDLFQRDFAAISFLRKNTFLKTSFDLKASALTTFADGEARCRSTNHRLRSYLSGSEKCPNEYVLNACIRKIGRILGDFDIDRVLDLAHWGKGATQSVSTTDGCHTAAKFDRDSDISTDAYALYGHVCKLAYPQWEAWSKPRFVESCKVLTVPKNAKTDRTIAIEPGLNSWIQLGIGGLLRRRLRYAGFNLDSDWKNQRGAYIGSIDDSLATLDFEAASDSISCEVVELLLPRDWYLALNAARSKTYRFESKDCPTFWSEKFSTMGNGFTFELESLIYVTVALAVCEYLGLDDHHVAIFGDDLIVPSSAVAEVESICTFLGFRLNRQKSFSAGCFRESCGSYFFDGNDVKPIFLKKKLADLPSVYKLLNQLTALSMRTSYARNVRYRSCWSLLYHLLPADLRLRGPYGSGDGCIHVDVKDVDTLSAADDGWEGCYFSAFIEQAVGEELDSIGLLLTRLTGFGNEIAYGNFIPIRGKTYRRLKRRMFVRQWYAIGPWT